MIKRRTRKRIIKKEDKKEGEKKEEEKKEAPDKDKEHSDHEYDFGDLHKCPHKEDEKDTRVLGIFTAETLKHKGWGDVDRSKITVEDKSGFGGSKTYKISCEGAKPPAIAFHCRRGEHIKDEHSELRTEAAATYYAHRGAAPKRWGEGEDWFIEAWEGKALGAHPLCPNLQVELDKPTPRFVLVEKDDKSRLIFDKLTPQALPEPPTLPLSLKSHEGKGLALDEEKKREHGGYAVEIMKLADVAEALQVWVDDEGFIHKAGAPTRVFDCENEKYEEGTEVILWVLRGKDNQKFDINTDGTISPSGKEDIVWGWNEEKGTLELVKKDSERKLVFETLKPSTCGIDLHSKEEALDE